MLNQKRRAKRSAPHVAKVAGGKVVGLAPNDEGAGPDPDVWLPASKVRQRLGGISPVTFWRWRHNPELGFPLGRRINGRWYFQWHRVATWHAQRAEAA